MTPDDKVKALVETISLKDYERFLRDAADNFYEKLLYTVQAYLRENVEFNLQGDIDHLRFRANALEKELREVSDALGVSPYSHDARMDQIDFLNRRSATFCEAQGAPTQRAETTGSVGEADGGPVPQACAQNTAERSLK